MTPPPVLPASAWTPQREQKPIVVETATVYRAAGRRYFRKASAVRALARALIRAHCYCSPGDHVTPGEVCHLHRYPHNGGDLQRRCDVILPRLTRFIAWRLRRMANG